MKITCLPALLISVLCCACTDDKVPPPLEGTYIGFTSTFNDYYQDEFDSLGNYLGKTHQVDSTYLPDTVIVELVKGDSFRLGTENFGAFYPEAFFPDKMDDQYSFSTGVSAPGYFSDKIALLFHEKSQTLQVEQITENLHYLYPSSNKKTFAGTKAK